MKDIWVVMKDDNEAQIAYDNPEMAVEMVVADMQQVYMKQGREYIQPDIRKLINSNGQVSAVFIRYGRLSKTIWRTSLFSDN